jgi:large subunit ribosomal protein L4
MEISVYNIKGEDTGKKVTLEDSVFGIEPNDHIIYLDVKQHMANKRQGTAKTKERSEITGSTRKLGRQKGGGGARRGDVKSPVMIGGGRIFGPKPRDYGFKLNKKEKALARRSALSYKLKGEAITVVEDFTLDVPRPKEFLDIVKNLNIENKKLLVVLPENNDSIYLSARNVQKANITTVSELNTYKVLNAAHLVILEGSVDALNNF